ncbi:MAG: aminopeptidase [Oscillospiraceae bacterium]|nr:aminopeptidase [Oscillospiraceae bacterium]
MPKKEADASKTDRQKAKALEDRLLAKGVEPWQGHGTIGGKIEAVARSYADFLDKARTERLCVAEAVRMAEEAGFKDIRGAHGKGGPSKVYAVIKDKAVMLAVLGGRGLGEGVNLIGSHIDAPRIDLKQCPLYEDSDLALFKTHYYGGIKKYQWVAVPLSIHGVFAKKDGGTVSMSVGDGPDDPQFTITDLLPHLAQDQMSKKMSEAITGEGLNLLVGSVPFPGGSPAGKVKLGVMSALNGLFGIDEADFVSAELEVVPSFKTRDIGFDRGMIGGYGHDDRACAFCSLKALVGLKNPARTAVCLLTDKEEIGSTGNTGAESNMLENFLGRLCEMGGGRHEDWRACLERSHALSGDVNAGVDPNYDGVQDKRNTTYMGRGVVLQKYTGVRGKYGGSDANAEFLAKVRNCFDKAGVVWQAGELGKVDNGGGGTIAMYQARYGMEVLDVGIPILSMHSPFEVASKYDLYMYHKCNEAFYASMA